jgi:hypothetical protein
MRVAVLLSGQMRIFDDPVLLQHYYEKLFEPLNADIFVSTWDNRGYSYNHGASEIQATSNDLITKDMIKAAYKERLKGVEIETMSDFEAALSDEYREIYTTGFEWSGLKIKGTSVPQFYKMMRVNELKRCYEEQHNFTYDLVIRARPDVDMLAPLEARYMTDLDKNLYHINCTGTFWPYRIYDIFFYSSSKNMDTMAAAYYNIPTLIEVPFDNKLHPRDACRLLFLLAVATGINVVDMDYSPCIVIRTNTSSNPASADVPTVASDRVADSSQTPPEPVVVPS